MLLRLFGFFVLCNLLCSTAWSQATVIKPIVLPKGFQLDDGVATALDELKEANRKITTRDVDTQEWVYVKCIERYGLFGRKCRIVLVPRLVKSSKSVQEVSDGFDGGLGWNEPGEEQPNNAGLAISSEKAEPTISPKVAGLRAGRFRELSMNYLVDKLQIPLDQLKYQIDPKVSPSKDIVLVIGQLNFVTNPAEPSKEYAFRIFASIDAKTFQVADLQVQAQQRVKGLDAGQKKEAQNYDPGDVLRKAVTDRFAEYLKAEVLKMSGGGL